MPGSIRLLGLWLAITGTTSLLSAQTAELSGFVKDQSGATVPRAHIELRSQERGTRFRTTTNKEGLYGIPGLYPGSYDATVRAEGFRTLTRDGILLNVGDRAGLDFSLQLSGVSTSITVSPTLAFSGGEAPVTQGASVGTLVDQRFVSNMPLNGRSFQSLIHLTPGVAIAASGAETPGQFSVNGQRTNANYITVDGVSANFATGPFTSLGQTTGGTIPAFNIMGGTNGLVSVDAMQEFRIQTSSYAPEYGRSPGAQISIVTKSGSNEFHGAAFDYLRNDVFDARNWFNTVPQPKPPLRQNNFGGRLGGPIRREHTFFFVSYEGLRLREPRTASGNFPTAQFRAQAAPVYRPFLNAYPLPNGPVNPNGITAPLTIAYSDPWSMDATSVRIDHVTTRATFFGRYNHAPSSLGAWQFAQLETDRGDIETATGGATIVIRPDQVNDLRVNWSRAATGASFAQHSIYGAVAPPASAIFPAFSDPEKDSAVFGAGYLFNYPLWNGTYYRNVQRQVNVIDTFSMTAGAHLLKFGVDYRRMQPTNAPSSYRYTASAGYQSILAGKVDAVGITGNESVTMRLHNYSLFAQDSWKISPRLTLTYGLRGEINTPPASTTAGKPLYTATGIFDSRAVGLAPDPLFQTQFGIGPRAGATWMIAPNSVVRGGFGLFHDMGYGAKTPSAWSFPYTRSAFTIYSQAVPFDLSSAAFQPLPLPTALSNGQGVSAVDPHLRLPLTYQWSIAWERSFGNRQSLTATYIGARGMNLIRRDYVVPPDSVFAQNRNRTGVTYNSGDSRYHGLQLQFLRRMSRGLQAIVSYTLSQSLDTISTDAGANAGATEICAGSVQELRAQAPPMAPSDFDSRHLFSSAISWELPAPRRFAQWLLRGWTLDGIVRAQSARPINVFFVSYNAVGQTFVQADVVPGQPVWLADANEPRGRVINPGAFAAPAAGRSGNFPRNSLRGFPFSQADVALRRQFRLGEHLKLDLRAEYFNVLNHPSFENPSGMWGASYGQYDDFGKVYPGYTLNLALGGGGNQGGQAATYAPGGPRSAQFTVRLTF